MPTGSLIRDFYKEYRELRYSNQGSIDFSNIEINAYRMALTLEVTHLGAPRYGSFKTLPENTHYGYVTLFKGSTVSENIPIKFPKFRVFDIINQGIWNHHHGTESVGLTQRFIEASSSAVIRSGESANPAAQFLSLILGAAQFVGEQFQDGFNFLVDAILGDEVPGPDSPTAEPYRALPVASPFPTVVKFKGDVPLSFLWRLELWYLMPPTVYIVDNPTDGDDQTDDESEYPTPSDSPSFPTPSPPGVGRDPRDFGDGEPGELDPGTAVQWEATGSATILGGNGQQTTSMVGVDFIYELNGSPFVVTNGPTILNTQTSTTYYSGLIVKDRFGQTVMTKYEGVGFTAQTISMNFSFTIIDL